MTKAQGGLNKLKAKTNLRRCSRQRRSRWVARPWNTRPSVWERRACREPRRFSRSRRTSSWCRGSACPTEAPGTCRTRWCPLRPRSWGRRLSGWSGRLRRRWFGCAPWRTPWETARCRRRTRRRPRQPEKWQELMEIRNLLAMEMNAPQIFSRVVTDLKLFLEFQNAPTRSMNVCIFRPTTRFKPVFEVVALKEF